MRQFLKAGAGLFGVGLCVAGLWYLFDFVRKVDFAQQLAVLDGARIGMLIVLTTCLAGANVLIAMSWRDILTDCGATISTVCAQKLFSVTNLGKYVPGNVLHMIGRQVLAMREGVPALAAAKSLSLETALLIFTSATFAGAVWLVTRVEGATVGVLLSGLLLAALGVGVLLRRIGLTGSARATLGYCAYHMIGGTVFAALFVVLGAASMVQTSFGFLVMAYVASWVLGLVTPGAPAGLGVREAVLIGLLQSSVSDQAALSAVVLLSRVMSVIADFSYFFALRIWSISRSGVARSRS